MGRKIFRPGNPNFKTKPELLREPSTRLRLHLPTITQTKEFDPKNRAREAHRCCAEAGFCSLPCPVRSDGFQGFGENEILYLFLQREDASASKAPRLGWMPPSPTSWQGSRGQGSSGGTLFGRLPFCLITAIGGGSF